MTLPKWSWITDDYTSIDGLINMLKWGVPCVQLRMKKKSKLEVRRILRTLSPQALERIALNSHFDLVLDQSIPMLQLPESFPSSTHYKAIAPDIKINRSVHSVESGLKAATEGADALTFGPIFPSSCKPHVPAQGIDSLTILCKEVSIPVYAIGGINCSNIKDCLNAGAYGVQIRSFLSPLKPEHTMQHIQQIEKVLCS